MTLFTSTNGTVFDLSDGAVRIQGRTPTIPASSMGDAIREAVQHENDLRIGRWRDTVHKHYVFYPHVNPSEVTFVDEEDGSTNIFFREDEAGLPGTDAEAARRYFDAHPEPEPWHLAQLGTSWRVTTTGGTAVYNVVGAAGLERFARALAVGVEELALKDPSINDAVRIYPVEEA